MILLGIDPGLERMGYGVIRKEGSRLLPVDFGLLQTPRIALPDRLRLLHEGVDALLETHQPSLVVTEKLLFTVNKTTAMDVSKAVGVVLLAAAQRGIPWQEFPPPMIKQAVCGVGNAEKKQVQFMVTKLLGLAETPKPDDVADALGIAICGAMRGLVTDLNNRLTQLP